MRLFLAWNGFPFGITCFRCYAYFFHFPIFWGKVALNSLLRHNSIDWPNNEYVLLVLGNSHDDKVLLKWLMNFGRDKEQFLREYNLNSYLFLFLSVLLNKITIAHNDFFSNVCTVTNVLMRTLRTFLFWRLIVFPAVSLNPTIYFIEKTNYQLQLYRF